MKILRTESLVFKFTGFYKKNSVFQYLPIFGSRQVF